MPIHSKYRPRYAAILFVAAAFLGACVKPEETRRSAVGADAVVRIPDRGLQKIADGLLPNFPGIGRVPVYIATIAGGEGVANMVCQPARTPTIFFRPDFAARANERQLVNIMKHELTHAWFCRQGIAAGHDARFRRKFESVGGFGN